MSQQEYNILRTEIKYLEVEVKLKQQLLEDKKKQLIALQYKGFSDDTVFEGLTKQYVKKGQH